MTDESLYIDEINVVRAPGFDSGGFPVEDLSGGVNIVHGPNASGKTTLARCIHCLLWPDQNGSSTTVIGRFAFSEEDWRVDVDRGRVEYQREGQESNGPSLPPSDQRDRYVLSLHELLQHETRDESFAKAIQRESAGGYDLSTATEALDFDDSPSTRRLGVVKDVVRTVEAWRDAESEIDELRDQQHRLPRLRRELEDAREAQQGVKLLEQAIDHAGARDELDVAERELETYPEILADFTGDEADNIADLDDRIDGRESKRGDAEGALAEADGELDEADLPDEGLPDGFVEQLDEQQRELATLEDRKREHEANLADFRRRRAKALESIPIDVDEGDIEELDPTTWKDISAFARTAERVRADRELYEAVERWLSEDDRPGADLSSLKRGSQALEQWLANPPTETSDAIGVSIPIAFTSVVLAAVGVAVGLLVNPLGFVLLPIAGGLLWYGYRSRDKTDTDEHSRTTYRETFERVGLEPPVDWSEDEVRQRLMEIFDAIAEDQFAQEQAQFREGRTGNINDLEEQEAALEERRDELRDRLGATPETDEVELVVTVNAILRWQDAHDRFVSLEAKIEAVTDQIEEKREAILEELAPYGYVEVDDAAHATRHIRDLERRGTMFDQATQAISQAEETIDESDTKIDELETQRTAVFTDLGLDPDEKDRLRTLCEQVDAFQEAKQRRDDAKLLAEKEEVDLEELPEYEADLKTPTIAELEQAKSETNETAMEYDSIYGKITEIKTKIDDAKYDNKVEDTLARKQRALDALSDQLGDDYDSMVGHVLADHVREATDEASRPEVFQHAQSVLARISKGQYRLDLDDGEDTFRAYDTIKDRGFALDELSSATRLQVLLAVRLAFVEQQEQGIRLPLLLDETLANSDDGKADIIIESMIELVREGRQVFYMTAQGDEVAKWKASIDGIEDVDHTVIDLAEIQGLDDHVDIPNLDEYANRPTQPPDIDGHDHASYGEALDVPPFNPHAGAGATHLWYLVEDLDLLYHLLELGIERWGQIDTLLEMSIEEIVTEDPELLEILECTGRGVEEFVSSWAIGRGEPVDRQVLEASGAVSENFIDRVTQLCEDVNGEAVRIIEALLDGKVNRFRRGKTVELQEFFEDHGYIDSIDPLEPEQVQVRVIDCLHRNGVLREEATEQGQVLLARLAS